MVATRCKQKKKILKCLQRKAEENICRWSSSNNRLKEARAEAEQNMVTREAELESSREKLKESELGQASVAGQCLKMLSGHFKLAQEAQHLKEQLHKAKERIGELSPWGRKGTLTS